MEYIKCENLNTAREVILPDIRTVTDEDMDEAYKMCKKWGLVVWFIDENNRFIKLYMGDDKEMHRDILDTFLDDKGAVYKFSALENNGRTETDSK